MKNEHNKHGWDTPPQAVVSEYLNAIESFLSSEEEFENFRRNPKYGVVLSGGDRLLGELQIEYLKSDMNAARSFSKRMDEIKINDLVGNPILHKFGENRIFASDTLQYARNSSIIDCSFVKKDENQKIKKIVEIGGGYGGMCLILHSFIPFEEYVMIDLPPAIKLCKKYLDHFPRLKDKITYINCGETEKIQSLTNIDLAIAAASLAECGEETQFFYKDQIIKKARFCYMVYNTLHVSGYASIFEKFCTDLQNNFVIDSSVFPNSSVLEVLMWKK